MNPSTHRPVEPENANGFGKLVPNAARKGCGALAWSDHGAVLRQSYHTDGGTSGRRWLVRHNWSRGMFASPSPV
jgi:hypothetical protein